MGKLKHNWKARQNLSNGVLKKPSSKEEIKLDLDIPLDESKYDESNIFALPSKKEKSENVEIEPVPFQKPLSRKERKRIAQRRRRQMKRLKQNELLDDLQKVQISNEELLLMTSITDVQTKGRRRFLKEETISQIPTEVIKEKDMKINTIRGSKKKRRNCDLDALLENKETIDEIKDSDETLEIISDDNSETKTIESLENIDLEQENYLDSSPRKNMKSEFQNELLFTKGEKTEIDNSVIQKSEKIKNKMTESLVFYPKPTLYERKILKKTSRKQKRMERRKHLGLLNRYDKNASVVESESIKNESVLKQEKNRLLENKTVDIKISNENTITTTEKIEEKLNLSKTDSIKQSKENESNELSDKTEGKPNLQKTNVAESSKTQFILLQRTPEIQKARLALPILPEEHSIMESVSENSVVIICGQTGSGKTTQVPQFLYEAGYSNNKGIIGVTQPRRIAATSLAERIAHEMNVSRKIVSYQIRFEGNVTEETKIKFMTDGILLKEIQKDYLLTKYNVIIIDEAHERSMHTDLLIGLLSSVVRLRAKQGNTLKVIIMSATLRIHDFTENKSLFENPPPVIKIDSRQFPVTIHFNRCTPVKDYIEAAYKKVCRIHRELPEGGILVFVTGREEVLRLCKKLRKTFPFAQYKKNDNTTKEREMQKLDDFMDNPETLKKIRKQYNHSKQNSKLDILDIDLDKYSIQPMDEEMLLEQAESDEEEDFLDEDFENNLNFVGTTQPMLVLPLYSLLPLNKQAQIFQTPPDGTRLCVIATNVAETSLTIPNIKYVVDTGKIKRRVFDKKCGLSTFIITWTSQASANQRAGRAGRTGSGHCYRLYSSSVFINEFPKFSPPEITLRPIDDIVLYMKELGIIDIGNFKFPTPPDLTTIKASEERLLQLGALEKEIRIVNGSERSGYKITHLGRIMTHFSVNPRFGKMIACSFKNDVMPYTIIIVAALSVREIFLDSYLADNNDDDDDNKKVSENKKWKSLRMQWAELHCIHGLGDIMVLLKAVGGTEHVGLSKKVCDDNGLRYNALLEIRKLRSQLTKEVNLLSSKQNFCMDPKLHVPTESQKEYLCRLILAIGIDHVARKIPEYEIVKENRKKFKNAYQCQFLDEPVFIHPESVLYQQAPPFVVFQEILETSRKYMKVVSAINPAWIPLVANQVCSFSKPLETPPPRYDSEKDEILCHMTSVFGPQKWQLPAVELKFPSTVARYSWFGRFFLEGEVMSELKKYSQHLIISAANMIKDWAKFQQRTQYILNDLMNKQVDSKKALMNIWEKDPKYLLWSYCQWLPSELHFEVSHIWPPKS